MRCIHFTNDNKCTVMEVSPWEPDEAVKEKYCETKNTKPKYHDCPRFVDVEEVPRGKSAWITAVEKGRGLQWMTVIGVFITLPILAKFGGLDPSIAGTVIGMVVTAVLGAEAGARREIERRKPD